MNGFLRQIEVLIGSPDTVAPGSWGWAFRFFSDGSRDYGRMSFHVQKTIANTQAPSRLIFYNLNVDQQNLVTTKGQMVVMNTGWAGDKKLPLLFRGSVLSGFTERQGPDLVTTVLAMPYLGDALSMTVTSFTSSANRSVKDVILKEVLKVKGLTINPANIKLGNAKIGYGGLSYGGTLNDILNALGRQFGFTWSVQDGEFVMIQDDYADSVTPLVLDGNGGLLVSATPFLSGPLQEPNGARIRAVLKAGVRPWNSVEVRNSPNKGVNRPWQVHVVDFHGDTFGSEWTMDITSLPSGLSSNSAQLGRQNLGLS